MQGIVDRFENDIVVIEIDGKMWNISLEYVQGELAEGDVVEVETQEDRIISVRKKEQETEDRKEYMEDLLKDMWE